MTGEQFTMTEKAPNPKDLVSVKAFYELNPEKDDRPAVVKKRLGVGAPAAPEDTTKH